MPAIRKVGISPLTHWGEAQVQLAHCRSHCFSSLAKTRGNLSKRFIAVMRGGQLHAAMFARESDDGHASQAKRSRVTQQSYAGFGVVCTYSKSRDWGCGHRQQLKRSKQICQTPPELCMTPEQRGNLKICNLCAPHQPLADRRFEVVEVAGVDVRGFPRLNGRKNFEGAAPPVGIEGRGMQAERLQLGGRRVKGGDNLRFAIAEKALIDLSEASEATRGDTL